MKTAKLPAPSKQKRILVVDDHPITRQGLNQLLSRETDLVVCGEAENAQQALASIKAVRPDLILTDITMPGKSGLDFIQDLTTMHPELPILVLSLHDESIYAPRVLRAGARGYVMKSESGERLLKAIRQVLTGDIYVSEKLSGALLHHLAGRRADRNEGELNMLTDREFEVFQLIGQGLSTRGIAQRLRISGKTVETHRIHLKEKLRFTTGQELVSHAVRWAAANQLI